MIRQAITEGQFYSADKETVFRTITQIEKKSKYTIPEGDEAVIGGVLPHAGHIYSGYQTVPFFRYLKEHHIVPDTFIILHPNHTGNGNRIALDEHISWENCIGEVLIDKTLSDLLPFEKDAGAHISEHSAEVIIPFIQYYYKDKPVKILPICFKPLSTSEVLKTAKAIKNAIKESKKRVLVIASSDFSHFLPPQKGYKQDQLVLDRIFDRDIEGVYKTVTEKDISVCGFCPIMVLMAYAALIKKDYKTTVLARGHSGMVKASHDVVDYISILFQE